MEDVITVYHPTRSLRSNSKKFNDIVRPRYRTSIRMSSTWSETIQSKGTVRTNFSSIVNSLDYKSVLERSRLMWKFVGSNPNRDRPKS